MLLDEAPSVLCNEMGHNGQEIWWKIPGPEGFRGHHIQEIQDCFLRRGKALAKIDLYPRSAPSTVPQAYRLVWTMQEAEERFEGIITNRPAILIGQAPFTQVGHAVAWDGKQVYDPNGRVYEIDQFTIKEAWLVCDLS